MSTLLCLTGNKESAKESVHGVGTARKGELLLPFSLGGGRRSDVLKKVSCSDPSLGSLWIVCNHHQNLLRILV